MSAAPGVADDPGRFAVFFEGALEHLEITENHRVIIRLHQEQHGGREERGPFAQLFRTGRVRGRGPG
jgi:hypothetical protein